MDRTKISDQELVFASDDEFSLPTQEEIAELAYAYWEARGCPGGSPWEDWFRAERDLGGSGQA